MLRLEKNAFFPFFASVILNSEFRSEFRFHRFIHRGTRVENSEGGYGMFSQKFCVEGQ